jgi:nitrite reductase/ring-hydroxylating ferredoxin subunit
VPEGYIRRFYVDDLECAVARLQGKVYATSNYCTHLDCLLSSGKVIDDGIRCSCHGSVFDLDTGDPIYPPATVPIHVYPVREEDGEVFVGVSEKDVLAGGPRRRRLRRD